MLARMWKYIRLILHRTVQETRETIGFNRQLAFSALVFFVVYFLSWWRGGRQAVMTEFASFWALVLKPTLIATAILFGLSLVKAAYSLHDEQEKKNALLEKQLAEERQAAQGDEKDTRRREYIIERLKELIRQHGQLPTGWIDSDDPRFGMCGAFSRDAERFLAHYFDEAHVKRFKERGGGVVVLEE